MSNFQTLYPDMHPYLPSRAKKKNSKYSEMEASFVSGLSEKQREKYQLILNHLYDQWQASEEAAYMLGKRDMMRDMLEFQRLSETEA
ncbi:dehydrogenase with different specificities [Clostridium sp. SY8519]|uniref:dehydrogenase n=1 Tax=Clostridium sp. (strain SY8519) TaxID=1042156 RepID=UPI000217202A|nr:dehydrogenase [Clostridium sp. SY8519]BAK46749.1 dehydrogenase with different specificities [Clostridium sp. SY8519]